MADTAVRALVHSGLHPQKSLVPQIIVVLMVMSRAHQASDKRDKVYALHSIFESIAPGAFPAPDYSKPWTQVFIDAVTALILLDNGRLSLLEEAQSYYGPSELPSWVPDWSKDRGMC
jgi:hypothetical protein